MNDPCHQSDAQIDKALGQDWPAKVTRREVAAIARLPLRSMNERELIIRLGLLLDTAIRDFEDCRKRGMIDRETHQIANDSLHTATIALANIPK